MPDSAACAVVHGDPPMVFVAEDVETLQWVLALKLIAATPAKAMPPYVVEPLREALLEERWGDAVILWMNMQSDVIDVYPSFDFYRARDVEVGGAELQFRPLFRD